MKSTLTFFRFVLIIIISGNLSKAYAALDFGNVAQNMLEPVNVLTSFVLTACYVIGASFLFTSVIKYFEHRRNPLAAPISTGVLFLTSREDKAE